MKGFLGDIATAIKLTGEVRKARKKGAMVDVKKMFSVPVIKPYYWCYTMEWCLMRDLKMDKEIFAVFNTFQEPVQHKLTFTPEKPGDWIARARFWQRQLKPSLPPKMYHDAMIKFTGWYAHCLRMRGVQK